MRSNEVTRFRLVGDHSKEHCGCAAVTQVLAAELIRHGIVVGPKDDFDVLVVNGEGSMHHDQRNCLLKLHEIRIAQEEGKPTYLVNSVWDHNSNEFDDCLRNLNGLSVRGVASARDLLERHQIESAVNIDLSYFAPIDESAPTIDLVGKIAATDIFADSLGFAFLTRTAARPWLNVDMRKLSWSSMVLSLRRAKLLVAGRHHGMYAACRARIPFVPVRGNSHKFEDLFESAGVEIPIAESVQEAATLTTWALQNRKVYKALFAWMDKQTPWRFGEASSPQPLPQAPNLLSRATSATSRRNFGKAAPLWRQLDSESGDQLPRPRLAIMSLLGNGDIEAGVRIAARARLSKPNSIVLAQTVMASARHPLHWIRRSPGQGWWPKVREAAYQALTGHFQNAQKTSVEALAQVLSIDGPAAASTASLLLAAKLIHINLHPLAFDLRAKQAFPGLPEWFRIQEDILLNALCRRFDEQAIALLEQADKLPMWADPAFRALALSHRLLLEGPTESLLAKVSESALAFPKNAALGDLLISISCEAGKPGLFAELLKPSPSVIEQKAKRHLALAFHQTQSQPSVSGTVRLFSSLFQSFENGRIELERLLGDRSKSIAVVGNSPIELGKQLGSVIDGHDIVIRFNDFQTDAPFDRDYGRKTDIDVQTYPIGSREHQAVRALGGTAMLVQRHAFNIFEPRDWSKVVTIMKTGRRLGYLSRSAYLRAANKIRATPSAGFTLANLMHDLRGGLDRNNFFGFSFTDQLEGAKKAHYFNDEKPALIHDWSREALEFDKLFHE